MILDSIDNLHKIIPLNCRLERVVAFLKSNDVNSLPQGRIEIDSDRIFLSVSEFEAKTADTVKLETHKKYIDIQMPFSKIESIGWRCASSLHSPESEYDTLNDISFYKDLPSTYIDVAPGNFVVFFPDDAHAPGIGKGIIKKCVIKILI